MTTRPEITQAQIDRLAFVHAIDRLCELAYENSAAKGFWEDVTLPEASVETRLAKVALMHSELGELTEGIRKPGPDSHCPEFSSEEIELADVYIRIADYASARGLRLGAAIVAKMAYNATRPHKHGKAA